MSFFESKSWQDFIEGTMPALVHELRNLNKRADAATEMPSLVRALRDRANAPVPPAPPAAPASPEEAQKQDRESRAAEDAMRATIARMKVEADEAQKTIGRLRDECHEWRLLYEQKVKGGP